MTQTQVAAAELKKASAPESGGSAAKPAGAAAEKSPKSISPDVLNRQLSGDKPNVRPDAFPVEQPGRCRYRSH